MSEKTWWLSVMVERLRERGSLRQMPAPPADCFYGNPLRNLAQDDGDDMADPDSWRTDLCRNWELLTNTSKIWELLAGNGTIKQGNAEKLVQQLVALNDGRVFQWVALYEWLSQALGDIRRDAIPLKKPFPRYQLISYANIFERIWINLNLPCEVLDGYGPIRKFYEREYGKEKVKKAKFYKWEKAPPFAAILLIPYLRTSTNEHDRGKRIINKYLISLIHGELVETPVEVSDLPNIRTKAVPISIVDRFERAMAIDRYLYEHPELLAQIDSMQWPVIREPDMPNTTSIKISNHALETSEQYAQAMDLASLNRAGKKSIEKTGDSRYAVAAHPEFDTVIQIHKCKLSMDDEGPLVSLSVVLPADYSDDVYDLKVVFLTEAMDQSDTCFGHVDHAYVSDEGVETMTIALELRPTYASYSLLYQQNRCDLRPTATAVVMPMIVRGVSRLVVGVHTVLGPLKPMADLKT